MNKLKCRVQKFLSPKSLNNPLNQTGAQQYIPMCLLPTTAIQLKRLREEMSMGKKAVF